MHWPEVVVVEGNHEYYDTAEGDCTVDVAYRIWRRALAVAPSGMRHRYSATRGILNAAVFGSLLAKSTMQG